MKFFKTLLLTLVFNSLIIAQHADPYLPIAQLNKNPTPSEGDLFDLLFINNVGGQGSTGTNAITGVLFLNGEYWFSRWNSDDLFRVDQNNILIEQFTIPGVTGTRTFSTDGTNVYIGNATSQIFVVDPTTKTLIDTIDITSQAIARMVIYDENLDNNNGGFWIGSWDNQIIAAIDMGGNELISFGPSVHFTAPYDGIVDYVSVGGPYMLVHEFGLSGLDDYITQIRLDDGMRTGIRYNFADDAPPGFSNIQAGGLFLTDEIGTDQLTILGISQTSPSNLMFALELDEPQIVGVEDSNLEEISLVPNPSDGSMVRLTGYNGVVEVEIFDTTGRRVMQQKEILDNRIDLGSTTSGVYLVHLKSEEQRVTKRLIISSL